MAAGGVATFIGALMLGGRFLELKVGQKKNGNYSAFRFDIGAASVLTAGASLVACGAAMLDAEKSARNYRRLYEELGGQLMHVR
jgi:hypothetical protein